MKNSFKKIISSLLRRIIYIIFFACWLMPNPSYAINGATKAYQQEVVEQLPIAKSDWETETKGLVYAKGQTVKKKKKDKNTTVGNNNTNPNFQQPNDDPMTFRDFAQMVLIFLAVLLIAFLIFQAIGGNAILANSNVRRPDQVTLDNIEENLQRADVDSFLTKALGQQDYKLAVRLYFLAIMKELSKRGHIKWKRDKTNGAYLLEMRKHPQHKAFRKVTRIFEYAWYSKLPFGKTEYDQVQNDFKTLLAAVKK